MRSKDDYKALKFKAYVNNREKWTKVLFGKDEYQIVFHGLTDGIAAKRAIANGDFKLTQIEPAEVCETVTVIRSELKRLSELCSACYGEVGASAGFVKYPKSVTDRADKYAYELTNVLNYGITKDAP